MTKRLAERAGTDTSRSCEANAKRLELVTEIFSYIIWARDLRLAAAVSRRFYVAVWNSGLLSERKIIWSDTKSYVPQLAV